LLPALAFSLLFRFQGARRGHVHEAEVSALSGFGLGPCQGPEARTRQTSGRLVHQQPSGWWGLRRRDRDAVGGSARQINEVIGGFALAHEQIAGVQQWNTGEICVGCQHLAIHAHTLLREQAPGLSFAGGNTG